MHWWNCAQLLLLCQWFQGTENSRFSHVVTNKNNRFRLEKEQEERLERERQERERLERERQERERLERERQERERQERERLERKRQEREKKYSKKKDNDCTIEADSSYGTQKKIKTLQKIIPALTVILILILIIIMIGKMF